MKIPLLAIFLLLGPGPAQSGQDALSLMPQPDTEAGWRWDLEPEIYTPETLFEYINGEAEHYIDYNFVEMATSSHARNEDEFASFTIDIYDMGNPLNAFGIYSSRRRPELKFEPIGEEAIVSELNISFYKGRFFVQVSAGSMEQVVKEAVRVQAVRLASRIEAMAEPRELSFLPASDRLPHTLQYLARGFLGQAAFERALQARYELPSGECTAFVVLKDSEEEAGQAVAQFRESLIGQGQVTGGTGESGSTRLVAQTEYHEKITVQVHSRFVVGVVGYREQAEAEELLSRITAALAASGLAVRFFLEYLSVPNSANLRDTQDKYLHICQPFSYKIIRRRLIPRFREGVIS